MPGFQQDVRFVLDLDDGLIFNKKKDFSNVLRLPYSYILAIRAHDVVGLDEH